MEILIILAALFATIALAAAAWEVDSRDFDPYGRR